MATADAPKRPYRLWDALAGADLRWRYYASARNAQNAALLETRWLKVGATIEVYDLRTGRVLCTYKRHAATVSFTK